MLNLVIALASSSRKLTKEQIRTTIVGYAETASIGAFDRMFERDKEDLRQMGVPIITESDAYFDDDIGYRIDRDAYALDGIEFTPSELAVLSLAASVWTDASLGEPAARGLTKLRAGGASIDIDAMRGLRPEATAASSVLSPIYDSLIARQAISFNYRAASTGKESTRTVEPWRLLGRSGVWYLVGHDRDRDESRTFRLSRITTKIRKIGGHNTYEIPENLEREHLGFRPDTPSLMARLWVAPDRAHQLRERSLEQASGNYPWSREIVDQLPTTAPVGYEAISVPFEDVIAFARQVTGHGPDVVVAAPPELRHHVIDLLRQASELGHPGAQDAKPLAATQVEEPNG